jgi:hypothetical protein
MKTGAGQGPQARRQASHETGNSVPEQGADPVVEAYKKDVDRSLLRENLKLTVEQRLLKLQDAAATFAELGAAGAGQRRRDTARPG